jgi:hypothetical protein
MTRLVILETPYAGKGWWPLSVFRRWQNIRYARACLRDCLLRGEAPIASHLLYTQPGVLRDSVPAERDHGINAGLAWLKVAEASVVYVDRGVSNGMLYGMAAAVNAAVLVEKRSLYGGT